MFNLIKFLNIVYVVVYESKEIPNERRLANWGKFPPVGEGATDPKGKSLTIHESFIKLLRQIAPTITNEKLITASRAALI